jgi:hypothetical protein
VGADARLGRDVPSMDQRDATEGRGEGVIQQIAAVGLTSRYERPRNRSQRLHPVGGIELDLQAALPAIDEHACLAKRALLDRDRDALLLAERVMPPTW